MSTKEPRLFVLGGRAEVYKGWEGLTPTNCPESSLSRIRATEMGMDLVQLQRNFVNLDNVGLNIFVLRFHFPRISMKVTLA